MSNETRKAEYVYSISQSDCSWIPDRWTEHPVIKKTTKFVFVAWLGRKDDVFLLDREKLEQNNEVFNRRHGDIYYNEAGKLEHDRRQREMMTPDYLKALGLTRDASIDDIKRAYRRLAQKHHPDAGGSHEAFIKLQSAYETATRLAV